MLTSLKDGWKAALRQPFLLGVLFVYRLIWGIALYRFIQSVVDPLLQRYPVGEAGRDQARLFLAEAEFRLTKTDISHPYLWLLLGLLLARAILTPLINAGVFFSLFHTSLNTGYRFFKGMKTLARPFYLYYIVQMALTWAPAYFLWPRVKKAFASYDPSALFRGSLLLELVGLLVYGYLLHLLFLHLQFGRTADQPFSRTFLRSLMRFPLIIAVAALLLLLSGLLSGAVMTLTFWKAGLWTLLLYQAYGFLRTFMALWGITSQHRIFEGRTDR
jgi:hypothetical protein